MSLVLVSVARVWGEAETRTGHLDLTELQWLQWEQRSGGNSTEAGRPFGPEQGEFDGRGKMKVRTKAIRVEMERGRKKRATYWRWDHQKDTIDTGKGSTLISVKHTRMALRPLYRASIPAGCGKGNAPLGFQIPTMESANRGTVWSRWKTFSPTDWWLEGMLLASPSFLQLWLPRPLPPQVQRTCKNPCPLLRTVSSGCHSLTMSRLQACLKSRPAGNKVREKQGRNDSQYGLCCE